jgi:predicted phosphodiesterase
VRLLILSDLHREIWYREQTRYEGQVDHFPMIDIARSRPDVVVLAGDIDVGTEAVTWADEAFSGLPVVYVHGNHEGYGNALDELRGDIENACSRTKHVNYLDRREIVFGDVRFVGVTLWTDFMLYGTERHAPAMAEAGARMNDYRRIRMNSDSSGRLTPADTARLHRGDVTWLESQLATPFGGKTVVVTHMAPSMRSISARYRNGLISAAFASNLDYLIERADLWVHGHTHSSADYRVGPCRVICNPLGYPSRDGFEMPENSAFNPNLIVEV